MMVFAAIFSLVSCGDQTEPDVPPVTYDAPSITWEGHDFDTPMEITEEMNVVIDIDVPAGIKSFVVDIDSDVLNEQGISTIDFVNPADALQETIVALVLGEGQDITTATSLTLELSNLIPMILDLEPEADTDHIFTITIIDKENRTVEETCTFHYGASASVSVSVSVDETSIDLWKNTARVNVSNAAADVSYAVQYREKGTQTWYTASGNVTSGFILAPEYAQTSNAANLTVYTVKAGSGIYAKNIYEVRLLEGETEVSAIEFSTEGGDVIPNGDMSGWSMKVVENSSLPYPNPDGQSFWDSGNNSLVSLLGGGALCSEDSAEKGVAYLKTRSTFGVMAPGNMYTGDFSMSGTDGTARFGKAYTWTSRPRALSLRYKANVGTIGSAGTYDPDKDEWEGKQDVSRIYVAIVDWSRQHEVTSGMGEPSGMWDPAATSGLDEGAILGYGDLQISKSVTSWTDVELNINWYDTEAQIPDSDRISIVISCANSMRGDYLTGCMTNEMWVDDFVWVY